MTTITLPRQPALVPEAASAARIALALLAVSVATALVVAMAGAADAREWLGFTFVGVPDRLGEVIAILANNLGMLAAVLVASLIAAAGGGMTIGDSAAPGVTPADRLGEAVGRALVYVCDAAVAGSALLHALIIGAGAGAYGGRFVTALLPHGPLELAAYSVALALYVRARHEPISRRRWRSVAALCAAALLIAAPLEVFAAP